MSKNEDLTKVSKIIVVSHRETPWSSMQAHTAYVFVHDKIVSMATSWLGSAEACMVAWSKSGHTNVIYTDVPTFRDGMERLLQGANVAPAVPLSYNQHASLREGERNKAEKEFFEARPADYGNDSSRKLFGAGFDRGYDAGVAQPTLTTGKYYISAGDKTPRHGTGEKRGPKQPLPLTSQQLSRSVRLAAFRTDINNKYISIALFNGYVVAISGGDGPISARVAAWKATGMTPDDVGSFPPECIAGPAAIKLLGRDFVSLDVAPDYLKLTQPEPADKYIKRLLVGMRLVWFRSKIGGAGTDEILAFVFRSGVAIGSATGKEIAVACVHAWADSGLNKHVPFTAVPRECWIADGAKQLMGYGDAQ